MITKEKSFVTLLESGNLKYLDSNTMPVYYSYILRHLHLHMLTGTRAEVKREKKSHSSANMDHPLHALTKGMKH